MQYNRVGLWFLKTIYILLHLIEISHNVEHTHTKYFLAYPGSLHVRSMLLCIEKKTAFYSIQKLTT